MKIVIINGPNLNMTGKREPQIYGSQTLEQINCELAEFAKGLDVELEFFQSNIEGELVGKIQSSDCPVIINAGAYTHYSIAIADALLTTKQPKIEVHLSNVFAREEFRHKSVLSPNVSGIIVGLSTDVYKLAIRQLSGKI